MKIRYLYGFLFAFLLLIFNQDVSYAHRISDGNARAEAVYEPSDIGTGGVWGVYGGMSTGPQFPEINDGGWIMMAHSVTDPQLGDCHNGETNPAYLRVLRIGYLMGNFPGWSSTDRAGMTAWITYDNNVIVTPFSMNPSLWSTQVVQVALNRDPDTVNNANKWRFFLRTRYRWGNWTPWALVGSALDGPGVDLKCVTSGGWASSTSNHEGGSGKVEMENIHYLDRHISSNWIDVPYYNSPTWWEQHAVEVNSPYFLPVSYSVIIDSDSDLEIDTND